MKRYWTLSLTIVLTLLSFSEKAGGHPVQFWKTLYLQRPLSFKQLLYHQQGLDQLQDADRNLDFQQHRQILLSLVQNNQYEAAIYWGQRALLLPDITMDQQAALYGTLVGFYIKTGDYEEAISMYLKEAGNNPGDSAKAKSKLNISTVYFHISDFQKADQMLGEASSIFKQTGDTVSLSKAIIQQAIIARKNKDNERSMAKNLEAGQLLSSWLSTRTPDSKMYEAAMTYYYFFFNNTADDYLARKQPDSALYYLNQISFNPPPPKDLEASIYISRGEAWMQKADYKRASANLETGLKIAEQYKILDIMSVGYKLMAELFVARNDYQSAWIYERKFVDLCEASVTSESVHKMNQLQVQYAVAKKDKELAQQALLYHQNSLQLDKKKNQVYLLWLSLGSLTIVLAFLIKDFYSRKRIFNAEIKNARQQRHILQIEATLNGEENERERIAKELHDSVVSELLALRINIKNLSDKYEELDQSEDYQKIIYQSYEVTEKLRTATHNMMPDRLKDQGLAKTIAAFLQRLDSPKTKMMFLHYGQVVKLKDNTEKMLLMIAHELIQNIIKHAHATQAIVQLNYFSDILSLTVEDNGVGMHTIHSRNQEGMGWQNIRKNIEALHASIDIQSSEFKGTTVYIELLLEDHLVPSSSNNY